MNIPVHCDENILTARKYKTIRPAQILRLHMTDKFNRQTINVHTWADHLIPGLIFFPGNYNT